MTPFETVIGLEVHAQLKTESKIFCACSTEFGKPPNTNTCEVCLGLPGVLPVLNQKAVEFAIKAGLATHCSIAPKSVFARKNYFYPDLPKGYQISQYELPLCQKGYLDIEVEGRTKRVGLTRIHMEEDAGKLVHDYGAPELSHVDLNRAGVPLIEIVSEPDMRSSQEAGAYLKRLREILVYLDICDGNMEEGSFRCDANVSIRPLGQEKFGTRCELKNMNSFRNVEAAIEYEVKRQQALILDGGQVVQETRLWNAEQGVSKPMRSKEEANDYRYFPDPDLLPLLVEASWVEAIGRTQPELGHEKAARFAKAYSIPTYDAEVLTLDRSVAEHWETAVKASKIEPKKLSNLYMTHLLKLQKDLPEALQRITPAIVAEVMQLVEAGQVSLGMAKEILSEVAATGKAVSAIVEERGFVQVSDSGAIETVVDKVLAENPKQLADYRSGKDKLFGFFVGQTMKALGGKANPTVVNDILKKKLS
ncbi:MAG TPA: Asp-tRNA(Asn)/Glu-tRNA(Gln) amidotransferase GatCAB subunit B [Deltaproteobacteria bacterium]|nr:Asp-tRNA(Asn)/Glu-tRNA(Gln) amidotransferase GatCAB subunit B [Deltaproteobacteria bacterium]